MHSHLKLIYTYMVNFCECHSSRSPYVPLNLHSLGGDNFIQYGEMVPYPHLEFSCHNYCHNYKTPENKPMGLLADFLNF